MQTLADILTELKRRRVFRVAVAYAGVAFIVFQIVDATFEPLHLPNWAGTLVVVLLALGFPIAVALAWAFDITEKGVVKTLPKEQAAGAKRRPHIVIGNKTLAVVAALAILAAGWSWWGRSRDPLSAFEHSVAVMPFDNLTGDEFFDIWEKGMARLLITDLSTSEELYVLDSRTLFEVINDIEVAQKAQVLPALAKEVAVRTRVKNVILGDILQAGDQLRLQARLLEVRSGEVTFSHFVKGESEDDFFAMAQELSDRVKNHLEIGVIEEQIDVDHRAPRVQSAQAYWLYGQGLEDFLMSRFEPAIEAFQQAIALDTLLGPAYGYLMGAYYFTDMKDSTKALFDRTYPRKGQFEKGGCRVCELWWDIFRAMLAKDIREEIRIMEQILARDDPFNRSTLFCLGEANNRYGKPDKMIAPLEKYLELSDRRIDAKRAPAYTQLGYAYHEQGQHRKEVKVYEKGLEVRPGHPDILYRLAVCYLSRGDTTRAAPYLERYEQSGEEAGWSKAVMANNLGLLYLESDLLDRAQAYYRRAIELDPQCWSAYGNLGVLLIDYDLDIEEGLRLLDKALEQTPDNYTHLRWKGWGLYKQGRHEEALAMLERSWELRIAYDHEHFQHLDEARYAVAEQRR